MNTNNMEIRQAIEKKRLKYYEVAEACGVSLFTFSHWLQTEMKPEKKTEVLRIIEGIK
jgi:DNA-binding transcriptional regulator YiaG